VLAGHEHGTSVRSKGPLCKSSVKRTKKCNYGRRCGVLKLEGKNIGDTLIAEELAMPFHCGAIRCQRMSDWQNIIENQQAADRRR
jgi:hypothetical protein